MKFATSISSTVYASFGEPECSLTLHLPSRPVLVMSDLQENRGPEIVSLMIALLATTWISVILRLYARFWVSKANGADDWLIVAALVSDYSESRSLSLFATRSKANYENSVVTRFLEDLSSQVCTTGLADTIAT
jgi:hypothetical protein